MNTSDVSLFYVIEAPIQSSTASRPRLKRRDVNRSNGCDCPFPPPARNIDISTMATSQSPSTSISHQRSKPHFRRSLSTIFMVVLALLFFFSVLLMSNYNQYTCYSDAFILTSNPNRPRRSQSAGCSEITSSFGNSLVWQPFCPLCMGSSGQEETDGDNHYYSNNNMMNNKKNGHRHELHNQQLGRSSMPRHVAFICDGNSRWAKSKHLPTSMGHKQGADRLVELMEHLATPSNDGNNAATIDYVTLYGFSTENWKRTDAEIKEIFSVMQFTAKSLLLQHKLPSSKRQRQQQRPIQVRILGHLDDPRIPSGARTALRELENATAAAIPTGSTDVLTVCLAINYGGRQDIVQACQALARQVADGTLQPDAITTESISRHLSTASIPDPDMIIRTSGECRLSNFLLWDCAYTEIYITDTLWPDFDVSCWQEAVEWYSQRQRRFGARLDESHENNRYQEKETLTGSVVCGSTRMATARIANMAITPVNGDAT
jgi:undecaprenyl diphosphate synthase